MAIAPLEPLPDPLAAHAPDPARMRTWIGAFLVLGFLLRTLRYLLRFPLWEDETFVAVNFLHRGFGDLLDPLSHHQVAPLLWSWFQLACVRVAGYSELALRFQSWLVGVAALLLFPRFARLLLRGWPLLLAVGIFSVAYPCVRYAAEVKPYGNDLLASLVVGWLGLSWWRRPESTAPLWALALVAPLCVGGSFSGIFLAGAVILVTGILVLRERPPGALLPWVLVVALFGLSFLGVFLLNMRGQIDSEIEFMKQCWAGAFPPLSEPAKLPWWLLDAHTGRMFAFPFGDKNFGGLLPSLLLLTGLVTIARGGRRLLLAFALAPLALNFVAAALERYPYGPHFRFSMYYGPLASCLVGLGLAVAASWLRKPGRPLRVVRGALVFLLAIGLASGFRDLAQPYKSPSMQRARDFARWFWFDAQYERETVCAISDLGLDLQPELHDDHTTLPIYLVNQGIYSKRIQRGEPPRWELVTEQHPLWVAFYRVSRYPYDTAARDAWLADFQTRYRLTGRESLPLARFDKRDRHHHETDYLDLFRFAPLEPPGEPSRTAATGLQR